jgi:MFS family permease
MANCLVFFTWGALGAFFPLYAIRHDVTNPGFFFTTIALVLLLGRALGGKLLDSYSREQVILPCLFAYVISMVILAFSKTLPMFILVAVFFGIGHAFVVPALMMYALDRVGSSPGPAMGTLTGISPGACNHGHCRPFEQLSDHVPLFGFYEPRQPRLFLFLCEKKREDPLMMHISITNRW